MHGFGDGLGEFDGTDGPEELFDGHRIHIQRLYPADPEGR